MNKTIPVIIFCILLMTVIALAITGGETTTIFKGECSELIVNISIEPSQDENEYILEPNCETLSFENNIKSFKCICENNQTTLKLTPAINSFGNYTMKIGQYILKDNETSEPIKYNTTNPTSKNITKAIILPNNIIIERIIQPNEELVYIETKENYIIIPESNVTFQSVSSDDNNINIQATSSGYKCFDIYAEKEKPYSIRINDISINFIYNEITKIINFCTTFSTKNIALTWIAPSEPTTTIATPSGGGGGRLYDGIKDKFMNGSRTISLNYGDAMQFYINNKIYTLTIIKITKNSTALRVTPGYIDFMLVEGIGVKIDINKNGLNDFNAMLDRITSAYGAQFTFTILEETEPIEATSDGGPIQEIEELPEEVIPDVTEQFEPGTTPTSEPEKPNIPLIIGIFALIGIIAIILIVIYAKIKDKGGKQK